MIDYHVARVNNNIKVKQPMYRYVFGSNGAVIYAKRPEFEAAIWTEQFKDSIPGLREVKPFFKIEKRIPAVLCREALLIAQEKAFPDRKEVLFYFRFKDGMWHLEIPDQLQTGASVRPTSEYCGLNVAVEMHSHNTMKAFFSGTDDREESSGFRVYSVVGMLGCRCPAQILTRIGIYGHFGYVRTDQVFELPWHMTDMKDLQNVSVETERLHGRD